MAKGYTASQAGVLLALSTLASCLLQPSVAALADRSERLSLRMLMVCLLGVSFLCLAALWLVPMSPIVYAGLYLVGALLLDLSLPLLNALSVYYTDRGMPINFGLGRGVGSLTYALASVMLGWVLKRWGPDAMLGTTLGVYLLLVLLVLCFPRIPSLRQGTSEPATFGPDTGVMPDEAPSMQQERPCTLPQFFARYRWFSVSLVGVLLMAAFHAMAENYLIVVLERVGGDSVDLGLALAIATVAEAPVILLFSRFQGRAKTGVWLLIAAASFLAKAVLLALAHSVPTILLNQLWQPLSYGLYIPAGVLYAREKIPSADMVKGQAMLTSFYALGCSLGNFTGGRLIDSYSVSAMLWCGVCFAAGAVVILVISINKQERNVTT